MNRTVLWVGGILVIVAIILFGFIFWQLSGLDNPSASTLHEQREAMTENEGKTTLSHEEAAPQGNAADTALTEDSDECACTASEELLFALSRAPESELREKAAEMLAWRWNSAVESRLIEMYEAEPERIVRGTLEKILKSHKSKGFLPVAFERLKNGTREQQLKAAEVFSVQTDPAYTKKILALLPTFAGHDEQTVKIFQKLTGYFHSAKDPTVAKDLCTLLFKEKNRDKGVSLAHAAAASIDHDQIPLLLETIQKLHAQVTNREGYKKLLPLIKKAGKLEDLSTTETLVALLSVRDVDIRSEVTQALLHNKDPLAAKPLVELYNSLSKYERDRLSFHHGSLYHYPGITFDNRTHEFSVVDSEELERLIAERNKER